jgi:hypothetical protein
MYIVRGILYKVWWHSTVCHYAHLILAQTPKSDSSLAEGPTHVLDERTDLICLPSAC